LVVVVVFHVLPLKLYGLVCKPIPVSLAALIFNVHILHSNPVASAKVKVGAIASYRYVVIPPVVVPHILVARN
jgi:hypothetical protein